MAGKATKIKRNREARLKASKQAAFENIISQLKDDTDYNFFLNGFPSIRKGSFWKKHFINEKI